MSSESQPRRLYRSRKDKIIGGVCAGIAEYFNIDPTIVRLAFVAFFILNPMAATLLYLAAWIIMPEKPSGEVVEEVEVKDRRREGLVILGLLLILAGLLGTPSILAIIKSLVGIALVCLGVLIIVMALLRSK